MLKSVSAFEMFIKTHRDGIRPASVVDFLVLNSPSFPRRCGTGWGESKAVPAPNIRISRRWAGNRA